MNITESNAPKVDYAQAVVRITKRPTLAQSPIRYNKITVVASPAEDGQLIDAASGGMRVSGEMDLSPYISAQERDEVRNYVGTICLQNDISQLEEIHRQAKLWGMTILYTSGVSQALLASDASLPNGQLYCWLTHHEQTISDELLTLAQRNNVGIMINQAKDERVLYSVSRMIEHVGRVVPTNAIQNDNLGGVIYLEQADYLAENGISFWLKTVQKTYPFAMFLGKVQAYVKYYDAIIEHEVRESVAGFISAGYSMGQLDILANTITTAMARFVEQLEDDISITIPTLASMSEANQRAGIIDFVEISYRIFGEIRQVNISI